LLLFPNPAKDRFELRSFSSDIDSVTILDMHGRIIYYSEEQVSAKVILLGAFSQGMYIVRVRIEDQIVNKKLIVR
jgi:hypothetical protein